MQEMNFQDVDKMGLSPFWMKVVNRAESRNAEATKAAVYPTWLPLLKKLDNLMAIAVK